jgi:hypothetical protein
MEQPAVLEIRSGEPTEARRYEVGTSILISDRPFGMLTSLRTEIAGLERLAGGATLPTPGIGTPNIGTPRDFGPGSAGSALQLSLADRWIEARVHHCDPETDIVLTGYGTFRVSERTIVIRRTLEAPEPWDLVELALAGPALLVALGKRGDFCWHASAVALDGVGVFAFLGDSGVGKSTLAAELTSTRRGWRRAADDLLLIRPSGGAGEGAVVLPRFPQPKLPVAVGREMLELPAALPLAGIFVVEKADAGEVQVWPIAEPLAAVQRLVEHTVATRLFSPTMLQDHLDVCVRLTRQVRCWRLRYPHREGAVAAVRAKLEGLAGST